MKYAIFFTRDESQEFEVAKNSRDYYMRLMDIRERIDETLQKATGLNEDIQALLCELYAIAKVGDDDE